MKRGIEYTGKIAESELLGRAEMAESLPERGKPLYLQYEAAIDLVKRLQPGDPTDPEARFANDLHATIAEQLCPDNYQKLRFYTAVNSALDIYHGVDGFFEWEDPDLRETHTLTIDLTKNPTKTESKANLIVFIPEEELATSEGWKEIVKQSASKIVAAFRFRRERR